MASRIEIHSLGGGIYELEPRPDARVPARFVASKELLPAIRGDTQSLEQLRNVATLPGVLGAVWAMPDMHMGYGFPIGGVAAMNLADGVISPGGVGYDINCGVRLMCYDLDEGDVRPRLAHIADTLFDHVPCGVGRGGKLKVGPDELRRAMRRGAPWAVERGFGSPTDLEYVEEGGSIDGADPKAVSEHALARGKNQLGTLGSGNHFMELGVVDEVFDLAAAETLGLAKGRVTILMHSGSRGLGHQVCTDSLREMKGAMRKHDIDLPDPQLCSVPFRSVEGERYFGAMNAAVNFAFANRQILAAHATEGLAEALGVKPAALRPRTVYEVAHNIAKIEAHTVGSSENRGRGRRGTGRGDDGAHRERVLVHRKGATRAFPPGHPDLPAAYQRIGQPVLIPGDMERYSFVLVGRDGSMEHTFGSTCHGAGRRLSRTKARKQSQTRAIASEMAARGILVRSASMRTQQEEVAEAYKDVAEVVEAVEAAGLSAKVARLRPLVVVKG